jgi:hypothetical protein
VGVFDARSDVIAGLKDALHRKELDNAALANRLQMYSDVLVTISELRHHQAQNAIALAREALKA